jgi:hypothetical protein
LSLVFLSKTLSSTNPIYSLSRITCRFLLKFGEISDFLGYNALQNYFPSYTMKPNHACANRNCVKVWILIDFFYDWLLGNRHIQHTLQKQSCCQGKCSRSCRDSRR